jgi:hypothetical protein
MLVNSPQGGTVNIDTDRYLKAAQEAYPAWDIRPVFGGYLAVPKDTPVIQGISVDSVVEKIRREQEVLQP